MLRVLWRAGGEGGTGRDCCGEGRRRRRRGRNHHLTLLADKKTNKKTVAVKLSKSR